VVVDEGTRDQWGRSCIVEGQPWKEVFELIKEREREKMSSDRK